jgi:hypothetical protein
MFPEAVRQHCRSGPGHPRDKNRIWKRFKYLHFILVIHFGYQTHPPIEKTISSRTVTTFNIMKKHFMIHPDLLFDSIRTPSLPKGKITDSRKTGPRRMLLAWISTEQN